MRSRRAGSGRRPSSSVRTPLPDGRSAARTLLARRPAPTALVCGNDVLAFGALAEAHAMGIDVPRSLSVTGFDDLDLASHVVPPLTTMRVPSASMGRLAAEHLLARIAGHETSNAVALDCDLILRGTTAACVATRRARVG